MSGSAATALLVFRLIVGFVLVAHGYNHVFGGGRIAGTARWFASMGMTPGLLNAWAASLTEVATGLGLAAGLFTPLAAAGIVAVMLVAFATAHRDNGFFIFAPGQGYEYVLVLGAGAALTGCLGAGPYSLDAVLHIFGGGWPQLLLTVLLGLGAGALQLLVFWRPARERSAADSGVDAKPPVMET